MFKQNLNIHSETYNFQELAFARLQSRGSACGSSKVVSIHYVVSCATTTTWRCGVAAHHTMNRNDWIRMRTRETEVLHLPNR